MMKRIDVIVICLVLGWTGACPARAEVRTFVASTSATRWAWVKSNRG